MRQASNSWFKALFGVDEARVYQHVQANFVLNEDKSILISKANNKIHKIGQFSTPSLIQLRNEAKAELEKFPNNVGLSLSKSYSHIATGDAFMLHSQFPNAVFQAASQFNCLEFSSHKTNPEHGVTIYEYDNTQGPACALACAAGTVHRNYFVTVDPSQPDKLGQYKDSQINNLDALETLLNNDEHEYWYVENGYTFSRDHTHLLKLNERLTQEYSTPAQRNVLVDAIKVGLHRDVGVTFGSRYRPVAEGEETTVTQVYLPCIFSLSAELTKVDLPSGVLFCDQLCLLWHW